MTSDIFKKIADAHFNLAELYNALAEPQPAAVGGSSSAPAAPVDDLPPLPGARTSQEERDYVFARCPDHGTPWTVKEGGISKNGKPYKAFWKRNGKTPDGGYCSKKPDPSWARGHDPEQALLNAV